MLNQDNQTLSDEVVKKLRAEVSINDYECAHSNADDILCELLLKLGFTEVVETFEDVPKYYA